jgi:hypothetical protein
MDGHHMKTLRLLIVILSLVYLMVIPPLTQASTITECTFNQAAYNQGDIGDLTVTIENDGEEKIRVTVLTASIEYYYTDETVYRHTFYTDETLPIEIQPGQSADLNLPFSLPTNIAPGYIGVFVKAQTEQWHNQSQDWFSSYHPTYHPTLHVESPYKQRYEEEATANSELEFQVQELETINATVTNIMYILCMTTAAFVVVSVLLILLNKKVRAVPNPVA